MASRVDCPNCGGKVDIPAGYARAKIRCPECGYYASVPDAMRNAEPEVAPAEVKTQPKNPQPAYAGRSPGADAPTGPPLLAGTQDESDDDVQPYAVPGSGTKPCPHCRGELPLDATLCVHCGRDLGTGTQRQKRTFQPINREWEEGWPLTWRLQLFGAAQVVNVLIMLASFGLEGWACAGIANLFIQAAMQAFVVGTFDSIHIRRTAQGKTTIHRVRRIGFLKWPPIKIAWKKSQAVAITATHGAGLVAGFVCLYLLLLGILPGVIFYLMVIRPERFAIRFCDVYGSTDEIAFIATKRETAEAIAATVNDTTGLAYRPGI